MRLGLNGVGPGVSHWYTVTYERLVVRGFEPHAHGTLARMPTCTSAYAFPIGHSHRFVARATTAAFLNSLSKDAILALLAKGGDVVLLLGHFVLELPCWLAALHALKVED